MSTLLTPEIHIPPLPPGGAFLAIYLADTEHDFELWVAPELDGAPDEANAGLYRRYTATPDLVQVLMVLIPLNALPRWFRARHVRAGKNPSTWTAWRRVLPAVIGGIQTPIPPPLPPPGQSIVYDVSGLPTLPAAAWPVGVIVVNTADGILYQNQTDATWTALGEVGEVPTALMSITLSIGTDGFVHAVMKCQNAQALRYNWNTVNYPTAAQVRGGGLYQVDTDGLYWSPALYALDPTETLYLSALAYEGSDGSGNESTLTVARISGLPAPGEYIPPPSITSLVLSLTPPPPEGNEQPVLFVKCAAADSVRYATSKLGFPTAATVRTQAYHALDGDDIYISGELGALEPDEVLYVSAFAYSNGDGTGNESTLAKVQIAGAPNPYTPPQDSRYIRIVLDVDAIPLPDTDYPPDETVVLDQSDGKLYRNVGDSWVTGMPAEDLLSYVDTPQIADNAIDLGKLAAEFQNALAMLDQRNVIRNPGFEDGMGYWQLATGASVVNNATLAKSGNKFLEITAAITTDVNAMLDDHVTLAYSEIPPGATIHFSGWAMLVSGTATAYLNCITADKDKLNRVGHPATGVTAGTWTFVEGTFTPTATDKYVGLKVTLSGPTGTATVRFDDLSVSIMLPGTLIVDDTIVGGKLVADAITVRELAARSVSLEQLFVGSFDNLILNPGFEQSATSLDPWTAGFGDGGTFSLSTSNPRSGARCGSWNPSGQTADSWVYANGNPLASDTKGWATTFGDQLYFEAYVRKVGTGTAQPVRVFISWRDATGASIGTASGTNVTPTQTYQRITVTGTAPTGTAYAAFGVLFAYQAGATELVQLDDGYARRMIAGSVVVDGEISTQHLAARSAVMSKLLIDDLSNLVANPYFQSGSTTGWQASAAGSASVLAITDASVPATNRPTNIGYTARIAMQSSYHVDVYTGEAATWGDGSASGHSWFPVQPGEAYYVAAWLATGAGVDALGSVRIGLVFADDFAGTNQGSWTIAGTDAGGYTRLLGASQGWSYLEGRVVVPAGRYYAAIWGGTACDGGTTGGYGFLTGARARKAVGSVYIENGAVYADKLYGTTLSGLKAYLGDVSAGIIRDGASPSEGYGIYLGPTATYAWPNFERYLNFADPAHHFLHVPDAITITWAGDATFYGALEAATGSFAGTLSAVDGTFDTITAGLLVNSAITPTAAIRLSAADTLPGGLNTYLDLAATGTEPVLHHGALDLNADGSAEFSGVVSGTEFTGAQARFSNYLLVGTNGLWTTSATYDNDRVVWNSSVPFDWARTIRADSGGVYVEGSSPGYPFVNLRVDGKVEAHPGYSTGWARVPTLLGGFTEQTTSSTGEVSLGTIAIPASTLFYYGDTIRIVLVGHHTGGINTHADVTLRWGTSDLCTNVDIPQNCVFRLEAVITDSDVNVQTATVTLERHGLASTVLHTTPTQSTGVEQVIDFRGNCIVGGALTFDRAWVEVLTP